jgi:ribosomal protein S18 acetylase RimI-like enzyme
MSETPRRENNMNRHNIEFLWGWLDALRRRDTESMAAALDPDIVWHSGHAVRRADSGDAETIGRLLHNFNSEFDEPTPGPRALADRVRQLLEGGETAVLLGGAGPDGLAVLRLRPAIWTDALECYLAELYVAPERRGQGLGRALMEAAIEVARAEGATHMDLGTGEDDIAARALYESLGFRNREGRPNGPVNYFYEREL